MNVVIPPDIMDGETTTTLNEGENLKLRCQAIGTPTPTVTWRREDTQKMVIRSDNLKKEC